MTICVQKKTQTDNLLNCSDTRFTFDRKTLVIIDSRVDDWQILAAGVKDDARAIVLDRDRDSIEQINYLLQQYPQTDSLHLVSHGTPGSLQLGNIKLSAENLEKYNDTLKSWSNYLTGKSLVLYGCQVANGNKGKLFLQQLHNLTKANIAASTSLVGSSEKGGNWLLDYQIGQINPQLAFSSEVTQTYRGIFDPTISFSTSPDALIETEETPLEFRFELSEAPPAGGVTVTVFGDVQESLNQLNLTGVDSIQTEGITENSLGFADLLSTGFFVTIVEPTATLTIPIFSDDDSTDAIFSTPEFDDDDFTVTYSLVEGDGYTVDSTQDSGTVSFFDTPEDVPDEPELDNALELTGGTAQIAYVAYYGRPADVGGRDFWNQTLTENQVSYAPRNGDTLTGAEEEIYDNIVNAFGESEEADRLFGSIDGNRAKINQVYQFAFDRDGDEGGLDFWEEQIDLGNVTLATFALEIGLGAQNDDIEVLNNKLESADRFSSSLDTEAEINAYSGSSGEVFGRNWLDGFEDTISTQAQVDSAMTELVESDV